ncbi:MAG: hypothetical protein LBG48_00440, partial [Rickettsiales bacterium]|nr:hypothetical protein [Rickettsiales bacterium]
MKKKKPSSHQPKKTRKIKKAARKIKDNKQGVESTFNKSSDDVFTENFKDDVVKLTAIPYQIGGSRESLLSQPDLMNSLSPEDQQKRRNTAWVQALYDKYSYCVDKLNEDPETLEPPGFIFNNNVGSFWASYDPKNKNIILDPELIPNHHWHISESLVVHEIIHHFLNVKKGSSGLDENGHHSAEFKEMGAKLFLAPFFLSDTIEYKNLTPSLTYDPLPSPAPGKCADFLDFVTNKLKKDLTPENRTLEKTIDVFQEIARLMAVHNKDVLNSQDKDTPYGYKIIPMMAENIEELSNLLPILLGRHFFVLPIYLREYDRFLDKRFFNFYIYG